ncbi:MAG: ferrous iron transport protein B [Thermodesulfobacteriota bacterium]|nr:ferrous iron transport protein B [Thermodesulfobacteriota bacterium]
MATTDKMLVALAGQPNCGKSTVFNALTGASQHVANYPGVTVDKKVGWYRYHGGRVEVVDLPGTYSLTSYSPEERVSRDFILHEKPSVVLNVMDAANLKRCLYLTLQLLEMEIPVILNLNMMDVAEKQGMVIDVPALSKALGIPVVPTVMKSGRGKKELMDAIDAVGKGRQSLHPVRVDYAAEMEPIIREIESRFSSQSRLGETYPLRWLAIKLMEGDAEVRRMVVEKNNSGAALAAFIEARRASFEDQFGDSPEMHIGRHRYQAAEEICRATVKPPSGVKKPLSDRIDGLVCHRLFGPVFLVGVIWLLYYLSIVQGYHITHYTWPLLAKIRSLTEALMPAPGFIDIPVMRSFALWFVDSVNALLNYIPIFLILFALIAVLEDSGYMPRMAFIMDRLFSRYGLHGQSTLPMILGGIYVGGCAVPGVMSCKGIPDERSRLATILIIPLLNCLAKVPLYVLLINIYFAEHKGLAMFFISTISLLMVLPVSKILTMTVLRKMDTSPFIMEMPPYHLPTIRGVLGRALERVWLFIRKIITIVAALAVVIFVLLQFPGISKERMAHYEAEKDQAVQKFNKSIGQTAYAAMLDEEALMALVLYWDDYKNSKMTTKGEEAMAALNEKFKHRHPEFYSIIQAGEDKDAKKVNKAFNSLFKERKRLLREMRKERIDNSFLGRLGRALEPVTQWAGFNWRVNVALLSAFAAKESSVATLGALYEQEEAGEALEERMAKGEAGFTPLHALALMLFMVLYPPCLATSIAVKIQSGSVKWMLFSMIYPMALGIGVATLVFSGGSALGLSGLQAMFAFYGLALIITIAAGFIKDGQEHSLT